MGISVEKIPVAVGTLGKPHDHLRPGVLQVLIGLLRCGPVQSVEIGHGQDPITRCFSNDLRDTNERVVAVEIAEGGDVGGLVAVVDFLGDARGDFSVVCREVGRASRYLSRGSEPDKRRQQFGVGQIVADRLCRTGILDLDRYLAAVGNHGAMDLTDGGRGHGLVAELGEQVVDGAAKIGLDNLFGQAGSMGGASACSRLSTF